MSNLRFLIRVLPICLSLLLTSCHKDPIPGEQAFTFTDTRDGHEYLALKIGEQTWMIENLAYLPAVNGASIGGYRELMYYVFGYEGTDTTEARATEHYQNYGVLYNWKAAERACPEGWKLPSDDDWKELEAFLGMDEAELDKTEWRTSGEVGVQLKSVSGWNNEGNGSNSSGFNAPPGSLRTKNGIFGSQGEYAYYWTSSPAGSSVEFGRVLLADSNGIARYSYPQNYGLSIRCVEK